MMHKWGMVGTGRVNERTADGLMTCPDASLVALASRNAERGAAFAAQYGEPALYSSVEELVADPAVDSVYIASPNGLHHDHVLLAARAGKNVLCEKPMAMDVASCQDMIDQCKRAGVVLGIGFQFRQHPAHQHMQSMIAAGEIGEPVFADTAVQVPIANTPSWYTDPTLGSSSGILSMAGTHRIDILRYVLDADVVEVSAFAKSRAGRPFDDQVTAMLRFDNDAIATMRFGYDMVRGDDPVAVHGRTASVVGHGTTAQWWSDTGGHLDVSFEDDRTTVTFDRIDLYRTQVESFARAVAGNPSGIATGDDGLRAVEISAAIYESERTGRTVSLEHRATAASVGSEPQRG